MDSFQEMLRTAVEQLLGRASGPFHVRLILQPVMATFFAVHAGMRDARNGAAPFLWDLARSPKERGRLLASAWKDIGKIFLIALALDIVYQLVDFHRLYPLQAVIVAATLALLPYAVIRGPVTRLLRSRERDAG